MTPVPSRLAIADNIAPIECYGMYLDSTDKSSIETAAE